MTNRYFGERTPLGELIRSRRKAKGITQDRLADELESRRHVIIRWEKGEHVPQKRHREKLAELLGGAPEDYEGEDRTGREAEKKTLEVRVDEIRARRVSPEPA